MAPIRKGDGTAISPRGFQEVRKGDGTILWSAGDETPDSELLHSHFDATELSGYSDGDSVGTFSDIEGVNDLGSVGAPQYEADGINGNPTVYYDGVDDGHETTNWDAMLSTPNTIASVYQYVSLDSGSSRPIISALDGNGDVSTLIRKSGDDNWQLYSGTFLDGNSADTNAHGRVDLVDGTSSAIDIDGTEQVSGDAGTREIGSGQTFALGHRADDGSTYTNMRIGEVLVYDGAADRAAVYDYLSDKWAV